MESRSVDLISLGKQKSGVKKCNSVDDVWFKKSNKARDCVYLDSRSGTEERALGSARLCNKVKLYTS